LPLSLNVRLTAGAFPRAQMMSCSAYSHDDHFGNELPSKAPNDDQAEETIKKHANTGNAAMFLPIGRQQHRASKHN
jgi:hypothetical protein